MNGWFETPRRRGAQKTLFSVPAERTIEANKTRQGYARKRTLKPAGCIFPLRNFPH
jgi:hypothetical protein